MAKGQREVTKSGRATKSSGRRPARSASRTKSAVSAPRKKASFAAKVPRAKKRAAGSTVVSDTPLRVHVAGVQLTTKEKEELRALLGKRLERFAKRVTRATVRLKNKGGPSTVCRLKLSMVGMDEIVVEREGKSVKLAASSAARSMAALVNRALEKQGETTGFSRKARGGRAPLPRRTTNAAARRPERGSLIGRRVGRSRDNLLRAQARPEKNRRDAWVDTSLPGVSATDRKAGGGSTAARNTKLRTRKATATLEDSAKTRPSRKSTRKSANRQKGGSKLARKAVRRTHAPSNRARRAPSAGSR